MYYNIHSSVRTARKSEFFEFQISINAYKFEKRQDASHKCMATDLIVYLYGVFEFEKKI